MLATCEPLTLLFISAFYPPLRAGGYAQLCEEVTQRLRLRGHRTFVLASNYERRKAPIGEKDIYRSLHLDRDLDNYRPFEFLINWKRRRTENLGTVQRTIRSLRPDVVLIWSLWGLSKSIAVQAERALPTRVVYYLAGQWPVKEDFHMAYWRTPSRRAWACGLKRLCSSVATRLLEGDDHTRPEFRKVLCVSAALRDSLIEKGLPLESARIVYNGIDLTQFKPKDKISPSGEKKKSLRMLYAGQVAFHKGVHTAIQAVALLVNQSKIKGIQLTILGVGHPEYIRSLHRMVTEEKLEANIEFRARVPREEMPALLHDFDALILPSIYEEPLARIAQEAMASGVILIGTLTGGTKELLLDGENGLAFMPEDPHGLAAQIERLLKDQELAQRLRLAGLNTIDERFSIERMVNEIESYLAETVRQEPG